jgi:hypothetical protein
LFRPKSKNGGYYADGDPMGSLLEMV